MATETEAEKAERLFGERLTDWDQPGALRLVNDDGTTTPLNEVDFDKLKREQAHINVMAPGGGIHPDAVPTGN